MVKPLISVDIEEDVSSALQAAARGLDENIITVSADWKKVIRDEIQKEYQKGSSSWQPLTPNYLDWKRRVGYSTEILHATNQLARDIEVIDRSIIIDKKPKVEYNINMLAGAFLNSPYVYYHEFGSGDNLKRDFIEKGLENASKEIHMDVGGIVLATKEIIDKSERLGVPKRRYGMGSGFIVPPIIFWTLPLGKLYLMMGMGSDIRGLMIGSFARPGAVEGFIKAWMRGTLLFTKKTIRRRVRREMWR